MSIIKNRAWLTVGANVYVVDQGRITLKTIDRLTERDVILVGGQRFNRRSLSRSMGYSRRAYLKPLDDHETVTRVLEDVVKARSVAVRNAATWLTQTQCLGEAQDVDDALGSWRAAYNDLEAHQARVA